MYKISKTDYGFHLVFSGHIKCEEVQAWLADATAAFSSAESSFGVFVDMRDMILLPPESQPFMKQGQIVARKHGMSRSVVIVRDEVVRLQFQRIAKSTGIYEWERYIDAEADPDWKQTGLDWVLKAIDPDTVDGSSTLPSNEAPAIRPNLVAPEK